MAVSGHNNPKDFSRRLDGWNKLRQEDTDDLAIKVGGAGGWLGAWMTWPSRWGRRVAGWAHG